MTIKIEVSRDKLEFWVNDLALHGVGDIETAAQIDALLAAPNHIGEAAGMVEPVVERRPIRNASEVAYNLQAELQAAKRDAHNSEVAYKAAIEKQDELRATIEQQKSLIASLRAELRESYGIDAAVQEEHLDLEAAAKKLAACMDYPWEHMPEQGRASMREHAQAIVNAALSATAEPAKGSDV
jgi:hypothetical protein